MVKDNLITFDKLTPVEQRYESDLYQVSTEVNKLINAYDPNELDQMEELIDKLFDYSEKIIDWATNTANKIVGQLDKNSKQEWEKHSKRMSFAMKQELMKADTGTTLKKFMDDNVHLIKSLPSEAAKRIHNIIYKNLYTGELRAAGLVKEIMKTKDITKNRAATIARTEISRASTGLTKARSEAVGIDWFVWHSTKDIRTRKAHKLLDGVLVNYSDPPSPESLIGEKSYGYYLPGAIFNCRCYAAPLIRIDDVSWPAKLYHNNKIERMTRNKFVELAKGRYKLAA